MSELSLKNNLEPGVMVHASDVPATKEAKMGELWIWSSLGFSSSSCRGPSLNSVKNKNKQKTIFYSLQETYFQCDDTDDSERMREFIPSKELEKPAEVGAFISDKADFRADSISRIRREFT